MPNDLICLVYASHATGPISQEDLDEILRVSRENNAQLGITGVLLYSNGNFFQVLEGPKDNVLKLFGRIRKDPRHTGVVTYSCRTIEKRNFPKWTMGFRRITDDDTQAIEGWNHLMQNDGTDAKELADCSHIILALINSFKMVANR